MKARRYSESEPDTERLKDIPTPGGRKLGEWSNEEAANAYAARLDPSHEDYNGETTIAIPTTHPGAMKMLSSLFKSAKSFISGRQLGADANAERAKEKKEVIRPEVVAMLKNRRTNEEMTDAIFDKQKFLELLDVEPYSKTTLAEIVKEVAAEERRKQKQ